MTKLTVAMASYNHERFVGEAIESVLSQEGCDFELVIVDDGSKDRTADVIRQYQDPRIRFIALKKNQGACVALRRAIEEGSGEYVSILNSDDAYLPGKLKTQVDFLNSHPDIYAVFGQPHFIDEEGKSLSAQEHFCTQDFRQPNRTRHQWLNHFFYQYNALCHPTVMLRRECYRQAGFYDPRFAQGPDFDFWIRLTLKYDIHVMPEEFLKFRILSGERNTSAPNTTSLNRAYWEISHILRNYLQISTIEEYLTIFPEERANITVKDNDLVPYYLARLSLRAPVAFSSIHHHFGLETLYSLLQKPEMKAKLEQALGFTYADFIKLTGSKSIFDMSVPLSPRQHLSAFAKALKTSVKRKFSKLLP